MRNLAPDVGSRVEYKGNTYRVNSWLREQDVPEPLDIDVDIDDMLNDIIVQASYTNQNGKNLVWCIREEATHVSCSGICGACVPVTEVKVIGRVPWTEEDIEKLRDSALRKVGQMVW